MDTHMYHHHRQLSSTWKMTTMMTTLIVFSILCSSWAAQDQQQLEPPPTGPQTITEDITEDEGMAEFTLDCYNTSWTINLISMHLTNKTTGAPARCQQIDLDLSRSQCNSQPICFLGMLYPGRETCGYGHEAVMRADVTFECLPVPEERMSLVPISPGDYAVSTTCIEMKSSYGYPQNGPLDPYDTTCTVNTAEGRGRVRIEIREMTFNPISVIDNNSPYAFRVENQRYPVTTAANVREPLQLTTPFQMAFHMKLNETIYGRFWIVLTEQNDGVINVTCANDGREWLREQYPGRDKNGAGSVVSSMVMMVTTVTMTFNLI